MGSQGWTPLRFLAACALVAVMAPVAASAGTSTGTLSVSANITQNCTVSAASVGFGSYDPIVANSTTALNATGSLAFTCTKGASSVYVTANTGSNTATCTAGTTTRAMVTGTTCLYYELYTDTNRTVVWNTTNSGGHTFAPTFASSTSASATVYAQIPAGQTSAIPGSYTDSVTMTINF